MAGARQVVYVDPTECHADPPLVVDHHYVIGPPPPSRGPLGRLSARRVHGFAPGGTSNEQTENGEVVLCPLTIILYCRSRFSSVCASHPPKSLLCAGMEECPRGPARRLCSFSAADEMEYWMERHLAAADPVRTPPPLPHGGGRGWTRRRV